jgi:hypothetical protein
MSRRNKKKGDTPGRTHALVVLDKSGSMMIRSEATIEGFNEFISGLKQDVKGEVLVTLVQFDTLVNTVYALKPLRDVPDLSSETYRPGGMTALYDAVGRAVRTAEPQVREGDKVNLTIMTDGQENSSTEFSNAAIKALLDQKRSDGWDINYIGATEAAWSGAANLGIAQANTIAYDGTVARYEVGILWCNSRLQQQLPARMPLTWQALANSRLS